MTQKTAQPQQPIQPQYQFEEDAISLMDFLLVLSRQLKLIIIVPTIFCTLMIIYVFFIAQPIYVSTATFMSSGFDGNKYQLMGLASQFGFGMPTGIPLPNETSGVLRVYRDWTRLSGPSISMGQEISINTLQLAMAYSAVANGGYLPKARIIQKISGNGYEERDYSPKPVREVMSKLTSDLLLQMMEGVVNEGTATKARIPGFRIGGKTGTAEKFIMVAYSKREFISSFAAVFPIENPPNKPKEPISDEFVFPKSLGLLPQD